MDDKQIIELLWARAERAIEALARRFGPRLYRTAMNILGSRLDAEECVNDSYLAVWNAIPPSRPDPLEGFVYRIGRNTALSRLRSNTALKRNSSYDLPLEELANAFGGGDPAQILDAQLLGQTIDTYLGTIDREARALFLRRYWFGDSVKALAKDFGISQNTASVRLSRTRKQLKDYLYKEGLL